MTPLAGLVGAWRHAARDDVVVARCDGVAVDRRAFLAGVAAWCATLQALVADDIALHDDDAVRFAQQLLGAWCAGKTVWLPGDASPATLARLQARGIAVADASSPDGEVDADASRLPHLLPPGASLVLYTSGSTGEPVAIAKSLAQLEAEVQALEHRFGAELGAAEVQGTVSQQHIYGLLFRVLWPLATGRVFVARRLAYPEQIAAVRAMRVALVASPAHLKRLPDGIDWQPLAQSLARVFSSGGALAPDDALAVARRWGQAPVEVFGSTETGGIAWRRGGDVAHAWRALPGVLWRVADGRLEVQSPHLANDAWYATQDRAQACDDGFVLLGRTDRIVKLEERRISLDAIERRLRSADWIDDVRIVALAGARTALAAVVACGGPHDRASRTTLASRARAWLDGHVDPIALPRRWRFVAALPVDARGKTTARALQALFRPTMPEPRWTLREARRAEATLDVDAALPGFDGHFPQGAVLPGVVLVDWVLRLAADAFGAPSACRRMEALKFQQIVQPGARLQVELDWQPPATLGFKVRSADAMHAGGRLLLETEIDA